MCQTKLLLQWSRAAGRMAVALTKNFAVGKL